MHLPSPPGASGPSASDARPGTPSGAAPETVLARVLGRLRTGDGRDASPDGPVAVDATDRLLLAEAADDVAAAGPRGVVVVDDRFGALTLGAAALLGARPDDPRDVAGLRVHQDALTGEVALARNAAALDLTGTYDQHALDASLLAGARVVLAQLPRSLAALRDVAEHVARASGPDVVLYAGGRAKHMTPAMNDVLAESFTDVRASLARGKSRLLVARGPRVPDGGSSFTYPVTRHVAGPGLDVVAYGAAFAGAALDPGTRFLLARLAGAAARGGPALRADGAVPRDGAVHEDGVTGLGDGLAVARDVVDLGCGTGILATWFARAHPGSRVVATDQSDAAVRSAALTARANGVEGRVRVVRDDVGGSLPDASADVVLCNPPFHEGAAVRTDTAHRMFAAAGRLLRPGGELWCVWNSHLRYRPALQRAVGPTEQVGRDRRFTVTRSRRR